jgi:predicted lactoylglutathione lyase
MIGYVTLGTRDLKRAAAFYAALLGEIGAKRSMEMETFIAWSKEPGAPGVCVTLPFNKEPATVGNGSMTALSADGPAEVDRLHAKALELGARDEGPAGPRGEHFYAGYFRDLDGNKLSFFCIVG